jgi:diadenosine tetraphosphate (Ap4A) HIT family hydrolase
MPESAEQIYARVVDKVGVNGRLPMPPVGEWDIFPWELVDGDLVPKVVQPPLEAEAPRRGEAADTCWCLDGTQPPPNVIWQNDRWYVTSSSEPTGMPLLLFLYPREHIDMDEMDDDLASEFGRITNWLHRIMAHLPHVGRVHVNRWGDGGHHMHVWFAARPDRIPGLMGSMAIEWNEMLPPGDREVWERDRRYVASRLATHDGVSTLPD